MEEQEIPAGSGRVYQSIPAERDDTVRNTGLPKYLPIEACGDDGVNCELIVKNNAARSTDRRKRGVFSNLGALHNLAKIEEIDVEEYMDRKKRSDFTDGLLKARKKLLDGSPGGFFVEMLKTITKPVYN